MSERPDRHPLDDCPDCGEPMALVLEVLGSPEAPGGGAFRSCEGCGELYARAGEDRRWLDRRAYRMLAREVLRLRALVPRGRRSAAFVKGLGTSGTPAGLWPRTATRRCPGPSARPPSGTGAGGRRRTTRSGTAPVRHPTPSHPVQ